MLTAAWPVAEDLALLSISGETLLGIVSRPAPAAPSCTGVVIVVGGPQYRAGSHRQFVLWARALAGAGLPTLRFDVRGMGDSSAPRRAFTELNDDIGVAIDALLAAQPRLQRVVLCGMCDGASAVLLYLQARPDPRVTGLVLLNPWVRSEQTLSRTIVKHYYLKRLMDWGFWTKLLHGQVPPSALSEVARHLRGILRPAPVTAPSQAALPYQARMAAALAAYAGPVLLALSGADYTAKEFIEHARADAIWAAALERPNVQRVDLPGADHTLSDSAQREQLEAASIAWLRSHA